MIYEIFKNGESLNTIVADESFIETYCEENGYAYTEVIRETSKVDLEPTLDERVASLETQLAQSDETAIALYEAMAAQEEINTAQDDALIELYEMIGG